MTSERREAGKQAAGEEAARLVEPGMRLGLGTGSTMAYVIAAIGRRVRDEGLQVSGVPTSYFSEHLARENGISIISLDDVDRLHLALDGADEVDTHLDLIKGGGAAHTREKIVAAQAERFVVVVDEGKLSTRVGSLMPVPVEVLPMACGPVMRKLRMLGTRPELRLGVRKDGPVVTDQGFWIVDARVDPLDDPEGLARAIRAIPGVLDHGLFIGMASEVLVGDATGGIRFLRRE